MRRGQAWSPCAAKGLPWAGRAPPGRGGPLDQGPTGEVRAATGGCQSPRGGTARRGQEGSGFQPLHIFSAGSCSQETGPNLGDRP